MLNLFRRLSWQLQIGAIVLVMGIVVVAAFLALQQFQAGEPGSPAEAETVDVGGAAQFVPQTEQAFGVLVVGHGEVVVEPDQAIVVLGAEAGAETAVAAAQQTNATVQAVIDALEELGLKRNDIKTTGLSLFPVFPPSPPARLESVSSARRVSDEPTDSPVPIGYRSSNTITITVRDLDLTSQALDVALAAGANSIRSVVFTLADDTAAKGMALRLATLDAAAKAQAIADALRGSLRGVISISEDFLSVPQLRGFAAGTRAVALAELGTSVPVEPGELRVEATVRANFAFE